MGKLSRSGRANDNAGPQPAGCYRRRRLLDCPAPLPTQLPGDTLHTAPHSDPETEKVLDRLSKSLRAVERGATARSVHYFRTSCRRLESHAELGQGDAAKALRKVVKRLARLRKLAGRVRDLDVQTELLRELQVENARDREDRRRLTRDLQEDRERAARKLSEELETERSAELRRRIAKSKRVEAADQEPVVARRQRALRSARESAAALSNNFPEIERDNLHKL